MMVLMDKNQVNTEAPTRLPSLPGTYALVLSASSYQEVGIGRLGVLAVRPGFYVYVGSALGPGGLAARVGRHSRRNKRLRWHVDYLRTVAEVEEVWYANGKAHQECRWAQILGRRPGACVPLARFGASDCRCPSHLLFFPLPPSFTAFRQKIPGQRVDRLPWAVTQ